MSWIRQITSSGVDSQLQIFERTLEEGMCSVRLH